LLNSLLFLQGYGWHVLCVHHVFPNVSHLLLMVVPTSLCWLLRAHLDYFKPDFDKWTICFGRAHGRLLWFGRLSSTMVNYWLSLSNSIDNGFCDWLIIIVPFIMAIDSIIQHGFMVDWEYATLLMHWVVCFLQHDIDWNEGYCCCGF
jgi:hypothetical protein